MTVQKRNKRILERLLTTSEGGVPNRYVTFLFPKKSEREEDILFAPRKKERKICDRLPPPLLSWTKGE